MQRENISLLLGSALTPSPPPPPPLSTPFLSSSVGEAGGEAPVEPDWCFLNQVHPSPFPPHSKIIKPVAHWECRHV